MHARAAASKPPPASSAPARQKQHVPRKQTEKQQQKAPQQQEVVNDVQQKARRKLTEKQQQKAPQQQDAVKDVQQKAPQQQDALKDVEQGSEGQMPRVVLKGGKSKLFSDQQQPMVYSGAVDRVVGKPAPKAGDAVLVCDGSEKAIGWGMYNPNSMFRVRVMQTMDEVFGGGALQQRPDLHQLTSARIKQAVKLRAMLGLHCNPPPAAAGAAESHENGSSSTATAPTTASAAPITSVFRLVNSEGDRLSGLIVDVLGEHLVVASSAAWVEKHRDSISDCLRQHTGLSSIIWRPSQDMLREEGLGLEEAADEAADDEAADDNAANGVTDESGVGEGLESLAAATRMDAEQQQSGEAGPSGSKGEVGSATDRQAAPLTTVVMENGIQYLASPYGQKTGFYADQRDNREMVQRLAGGLRVLDLCCYTGGFALSAAAGGALQVVGVDSSAPAVELAARNAQLNGWQDVCSFVKGDVTDFMKQAVADRRRFDLVVFDPPKQAPSRKALEKATRKYRRLNALAIQLVEPGGLLMSCSCSGAMAQSNGFLPMLAAAARDAGRRVTVLRVAGAAPDHTQDPCYPEGRYLTNTLAQVDAR